MKKIILDCDLMKHKDSGLYHYCLNLGNYIKKELDKEKKEKILFYIPESEKLIFENKNACIIEKKWHSKLIKPFLYDCNIWHAPFQSGRIINKYNKNTKIVLTIHDLNVLHEDKSKKEREESLAKTQKLIHSSDAIICISEHTKSDVLNNLQTFEKPVYVIHNGTHHVAETIKVKPKLYLPTKPFVFAMGYINRKKNFHTLLSLLTDTTIELIIAGRLDEPDYINNMKNQAYKLGLSERLHVLGPISEEDKAWYYQHCMAFALPSLAEGFGAPVVEAMRFGKPIFLSNKTSLPEIGGDVCFYFSSFESEHMYNTFKNGMKNFEQKGFVESVIKRGNEFSWENKAKEYVKVYRTLL